MRYFQFCLKIWHLWRLPHPWLGVWVVGWVDGWGQVKSLKLNKPWPNRDISILFENSTSVEAPPPMDGCMGGWVGWWVGQVKSLKLNKPWLNWDISILFEDSTSVEAPPPMGGNMGGWVGWWVGSGQITKNQIYLDLIEIFQFCLKIQHLWRLPHPWVGVWVVG